MKLFKYSVFISVLFFAGSAFAMEPDTETITIDCSDEQKLEIPQGLFNKCRTLRQNEGSSDTSFWVQYSKADLEEFFDYLSGDQKIENITDVDTIQRMYNIANFLEIERIPDKADKEFYTTLIKKYKDLVPKEEIEVQILFSFERFERTINDLEDFANCFTKHFLEHSDLDLCNKQLDSLRGLYNKIKPVGHLKISNNNLEELDVCALLRVFPNLKRIDADNNAIATLILPKRLPKGFILSIKNNKLHTIPYFRCENGSFDFSSNYLSQTEIAKLQRNLSPNLWERSRHPFLIMKHIISNRSESICAWTIVGGWLGALGGLVDEVGVRSYDLNKLRRKAKVVGKIIKSISDIEKLTPEALTWLYTPQFDHSDRSYYKPLLLGANMGMVVGLLAAGTIICTDYLNKKNKLVYREYYYHPSKLDVSNQLQD